MILLVLVFCLTFAEQQLNNIVHMHDYNVTYTHTIYS